MNPLFASRRLRTVRALMLGSGLVLLSGRSAEAAAPWKVGRVSARTFANRLAAEPAPGETLRPGERAFLTKASTDSQQQMRLAEIGAGQAASAEVRSHAQRLAIDYRQLDESLQALIRRKGGIAGAPVGGTSETYRALGETTGASFDREFVAAVSRQADAALALFERAAADAADPDVREFAAAQIPLLRGHHNAANALKKSLP